MAKIQEEFKNFKLEKESSNEKITELSEKELSQVAGGGPGPNFECKHGTNFTPINGDTGGASRACCTICTHWQRPEGPCDLD